MKLIQILLTVADRPDTRLNVGLKQYKVIKEITVCPTLKANEIAAFRFKFNVLPGVRTWQTVSKLSFIFLKIWTITNTYWLKQRWPTLVYYGVIFCRVALWKQFVMSTKQLTYGQPVCRTIWNDVWPNKRREKRYVIAHNVFRPIRRLNFLCIVDCARMHCLT